MIRQLLHPLLAPEPESGASRQFRPGNPGGPGRGNRRDRDGEILARWNAPGPCGFWAWVADVQPHVLQRNNQYGPWEPTEEQRRAIDHILAVDAHGRFLHSLSLLIEPRRHGKSTTFALVVLWLTTSRRNHVTQLLGNTADHSRRTQFRTLKRIIANTPRLARLIPEELIFTNEITFPPLQSAIQLGEGLSLSSAFGDRLNCLWVSDLHASPDLGPFNALQASLLDSQDSLILIDANVDPTDGHVHGLQKEAEADQTIYARHVCYRDLAEFETKAPDWIDRQKARRLQRTALPADFKRDILGQRSDAKNALFPTEFIRAARSPYKCPVADLKELVKGRAYKVGGGLDRAKSLSPLMGGDSSVWTCVLKIASPQHGEAEYFVLNQVIFSLNTSRSIKKQILTDHEKYHLDNVVLENYEVTDLAPWLADVGIKHEILTATEKTQNSSFPELARIFREGRFHFSRDLKTFESELKSFVYASGRAGKYSFGAATSKAHDDTVYSANWAVWALRQEVLAAYVLGNIQCKNKSPRRGLCYLMGGSKQLLCADYCQAHKQVEAMFQEYRKVRLDDDLNLQEFFESKVRFQGARISQAA
jgi:hypothetical protein